MRITLGNTLPPYPDFVEGIRRAPDRGYTPVSYTHLDVYKRQELELQNARKRIYYISLLRLILFLSLIHI